MEEVADSEGFGIEFIKADEIFRNAEKIKNSDLIIFDTSLNSHAGYYKIKNFNIETLHLRKSSKKEIEKLFEI